MNPNSIILYRFLCLACCTLAFPRLRSGQACAAAAASSKQVVPADLPAVRPAETSQDANALGVTMKAESPGGGRKFEIPAAGGLWQSRIGVPAGEKDAKYKDELARLIEQIRSVRFRPSDQTPQPFIDIKPEPTAQDSNAPSAQKASGEPVEKQPRLNPPDVSRIKVNGMLPYQPVSEQTLRMLESLAQSATGGSALRQSGLSNPSELADILFVSGHLKQAAVFYQQALDLKSPDDTILAEDRAWILFQLGNCLRDTDPSAAIKAYRQLIAEYPDSLWTDLAKAGEQLVDWYRKDKPLTLIESRRL